MKKMNLIKIALMLATPSLVMVANAGGIVGSAHDFTGGGVADGSWNLNKDVCGPCHMAHGSDPNNQYIPLWSHQVDNASFRLFQSPHMAAGQIRQPDGASRACLSCHDGTLAWNQLKGVTVGSAPPIPGDYRIGANNDLRGDHPVSFLYQDAVNASPTNTLKLVTEPLGGPYNPGNGWGGTLPLGNTLQGQSVGSAFLKDGSVQCNSCHDVHRSIGDSGLYSDAATFGSTSVDHNPLLVIFNGNRRLDQSSPTPLGSSLCRSCHNK